MTLTRSQRGVTPRKAEYYGMTDETPATTRRRSARGAESDSSPTQQKAKRGRPRKNVATQLESSSEADSAEEGKSSIEVEVMDSPAPPPPKKSPGRPRKSTGKIANGKTANGDAHTPAAAATTEDPKVDSSGQLEFGGTPGVTAMMIGFPLLMYYMWIGATYYNGAFPTPARGQTFGDFVREMGRMVYQGAFPSLKAWAIYWTFFVLEGVAYMLLPGVTAVGKPLPHEGGKQLTYHCSGMWSLYTTILVAAALHFSGFFKLYVLLDEFGPLMSVAILSGFLVSVVAYISALYRGATHRMTGRPVYDFFMGAELNPRLFGILDWKMFFEVRIPWYMLFLTSASAAARQYEQYGYVSAEVVFLLMAHFLYANACSKGEDLIVTTWDMYYEKWGFMLIFWNLAGVPLSYCHCTIYLANHHPSEYAHSAPVMAALFASYLFTYWVWDTTNSQKNRFRQNQRGGFIPRKTFPQLPWQTVTNPRTIPTATGDPILADGWYGYARKIHYTCDLFFALTWGLVTGFNSPFPWFYPVFFAAMIAHRADRDIKRCRERYGDAWRQYERQVPYLFVPYVY